MSLQSSRGSSSIDLEETRVWDDKVQDELYVLIMSYVFNFFTYLYINVDGGIMVLMLVYDGLYDEMDN